MINTQFSAGKFFFAYCFSILTFPLHAQTVSQKLQKSFREFEQDSQLKYAISSLYVIDAKTGQQVFEKNSRVGLAPASTQKIITGVTAFELLGKDFRYRTNFFITGDGNSKYSLYIEPSGDPTLGSWRWEQTREENVMNRVLQAIKKQDKNISGPIIVNGAGWDSETIPDGWIWQDIGNYYGAGAAPLNWRENQFDIILRSGNKIGDPVKVAGTIPGSLDAGLSSRVIAAKKGSGDNAYIYFQPANSPQGIIRGTIPVNEDRFIISGALSSGANLFLDLLIDSLKSVYGMPGNQSFIMMFEKNDKKGLKFHSEVSPSLDSINYWFNKKSVNLYGESLVKSMAYEKKGAGSTDSGMVLIRDFWKEKNIDPGELNVVDGSGLSPLNRVTTHAQVEILKYAKTRNWFPSFYQSLPAYNGMAMKSGTIRGVKAFCGYHRAANGKEYIFSFIVNNYNGSPSSLVNKMYKVLNLLK